MDWKFTKTKQTKRQTDRQTHTGLLSTQEIESHYCGGIQRAAMGKETQIQMGKCFVKQNDGHRSTPG